MEIRETLLSHSRILYVLGISLGTMMIFSGLWQIEIIQGWSNGEYFLPFFIGGAQSTWVWRDIWYLVIILGHIIALVSTYNLSKK